MQLPFDDLPECPPLHRIAIKQRDGLSSKSPTQRSPATRILRHRNEAILEVAGSCRDTAGRGRWWRPTAAGARRRHSGPAGACALMSRTLVARMPVAASSPTGVHLRPCYDQADLQPPARSPVLLKLIRVGLGCHSHRSRTRGRSAAGHCCKREQPSGVGGIAHVLVGVDWPMLRLVASSCVCVALALPVAGERLAGRAHVLDGDTIVVDGIHVRLKGVAGAGGGALRARAEPGGEAAKAFIVEAGSEGQVVVCGSYAGAHARPTVGWRYRGGRRCCGRVRSRPGWRGLPTVLGWSVLPASSSRRPVTPFPRLPWRSGR